MDLATCQSRNNRLHLPHKGPREMSMLMSEVTQALAHSSSAAHDQDFDGTNTDLPGQPVPDFHERGVPSS